MKFQRWQHIANSVQHLYLPRKVQFWRNLTVILVTRILHLDDFLYYLIKHHKNAPIPLDDVVSNIVYTNRGGATIGQLAVV